MPKQKHVRYNATTKLYELISYPEKYPKSTSILNPKTGRFVNRYDRLGQRIRREQEPGGYVPYRRWRSPEDYAYYMDEETYVPGSTGRYIINPKTGRRVKREGAIGKKLMKQMELQQKKDQYVLNPKTKRYVKRTGAIGKKIIKEQKKIKSAVFKGLRTNVRTAKTRRALGLD